jgi:pyrimidine deaminase RibD-like protein
VQAQNMELVTTKDAIHLGFMKQALCEARKCEPTPTAFCVGCVIAVDRKKFASSKQVALATGYSRELPGNTHAEANALAKARTLSPPDLQAMFTNVDGTTTIEELLQQSDVYTTMEPCSIRASGLAPCANALIEAKISRCFIGCKEPDDFVNCEGIQMLLNAGISVIRVGGLEDECLEVARLGHAEKA